MSALARLAGAAGLAIAAFAAPASAGSLNFNFTFTGTQIPGYPGTPGTVSGEIFGLTDNTASSSAVDVVITKFNGNDVSIDVGGSAGIIPFNDFEVQNGQITAFDYYEINPGMGLQFLLGYRDTNELLAPFYSISTINYFSSGVMFAAANAPTPAPEPASLALLATGVGAAGLMIRRRNNAVVRTVSSRNKR